MAADNVSRGFLALHGKYRFQGGGSSFVLRHHCGSPHTHLWTLLDPVARMGCLPKLLLVMVLFGLLFEAISQNHVFTSGGCDPGWRGYTSCTLPVGGRGISFFQIATPHITSLVLCALKCVGKSLSS